MREGVARRLKIDKGPKKKSTPWRRQRTAVGVVRAQAGPLLKVKVAGAALALDVAVHVLLGPFTVVAGVAQPATHQIAARGPLT